MNRFASVLIGLVLCATTYGEPIQERKPEYNPQKGVVITTEGAASGPPVYVVFKTRKYNLRVPEDFVAFHNVMMKHDRSIEAACATKALMAVGLMEERDAGKTEAEHLAMLDERMVETKKKWHYLFVDLQRMIRDIHRTHSNGDFKYDDRVVFYRLEVLGCNPNVTRPIQ
jgi:hypothetical protein